MLSYQHQSLLRLVPGVNQRFRALSVSGDDFLHHPDNGKCRFGEIKQWFGNRDIEVYRSLAWALAGKYRFVDKAVAVPSCRIILNFGKVYGLFDQRAENAWLG
ncbi:MAG: hypothetical protein BWY72_01880 [Bacteroidetes bacterium ADurb.Bin416]|nr:MAG: hypothetical protein BWY72_01880 [Bacteroidetes bacterium ADurb.Bin416]